jgi:hypothetical protein
MTPRGHGTDGIAVALRESVSKANQSKEDRNEDQNQDQSWYRCLGHLDIQAAWQHPTCCRAALSFRSRNFKKGEKAMKTKTKIKAGIAVWGT